MVVSRCLGFFVREKSLEFSRKANWAVNICHNLRFYDSGTSAKRFDRFLGLFWCLGFCGFLFLGHLASPQWFERCATNAELMVDIY